MTYDNNGNQLTKATGATTIGYAYDALNRLTAVTSGVINSHYQYDGDGNRVSETVPTGTYQFLNDTATSLPVVMNENGPDGNIDYTYGLSMISETSAAFQYFYQADGLGSATSMTDANGSLKANYTYDPWGKLLNPIDPLGTKNKYKFTGESLDPGTQLYFMRARFLDPSIGRFISRDRQSGSILLPASHNKYQYALSNPIIFSDPSGLLSVDAEDRNAESTISIVHSNAANPEVAMSMIAKTCKIISNATLLLDNPKQFVEDILIEFGNDQTQASGSDVPCLTLIPYVGGIFTNAPTAK
jgi:RHS repeat-associated protein